MSITSLISNVLTVYQADTADMRSKLKELEGDERRMQEQAIAGAEARNKALDGWIDKLNDAQKVLSLVTQAVKFGGEAMELYGKQLDLQATAAGVSLDGLSKAAGGVKTNMQLLSEAAIFTKSPFKLTQTQMEDLESAMHALEERGFEQRQVWEAFDNFISKGASRSLEQFGIIIDKTGLAMDEHGVKVDTLAQRTELFTRAQKALTSVTREGRDATADQADEIKQITTKWANMWDELKIGVAKVVVEMKPLLELLTQVLGVIGEMSKVMLKDISSNTPWHIAAGFTVGEHEQQAAFMNNLVHALGAGMKGDLNYQGDQAAIGGFFGSVADQKLKKHETTAEELKKAAEEALNAAAIDILRSVTQNEGSNLARSSSGYLLGKQFHRSGGGFGQLQAADTTVYDEYGAPISMDDLMKSIHPSNVNDEYSKYLEHQGAHSKSLLEKTFGSVDEFHVYKELFNSLTGAVNASMTAWIDGSMSAGEAFKKFVADALKGLASQMLVESLKNAAYAIASLVPGPTFNPAAAAGYAIAAGEFAAGAAVAGVLAHELGGSAPSGSGRGAGAGAAPVGGSGYGGGAMQPSSATIVISDPFANDSARMKRLEAERIVGRALGRNGIEYR
jgi:hypothetical protein